MSTPPSVEEFKLGFPNNLLHQSKVTYWFSPPVVVFNVFLGARAQYNAHAVTNMGPTQPAKVFKVFLGPRPLLCRYNSNMGPFPTVDVLRVLLKARSRLNRYNSRLTRMRPTQAAIMHSFFSVEARPLLYSGYNSNMGPSPAVDVLKVFLQALSSLYRKNSQVHQHKWGQHHQLMCSRFP